MIHKLMTYGSPVLLAVLAVGSLAGDAPVPDLESLDAAAAVQLADDPALNMSTMDDPPVIVDIPPPPPIGPPPKPPCEPIWTCDWENFYPTRATCQAVCGVGNCAQDFNCDGSCICQ